MHAVVLSAALGVLIVMAGVLRAAPRRASIKSCAAFFVGLAIAAVAIKAAGHTLQLYPNDQLAQFAAHAAASDDDRPTIMFWGTSMSRNAIDDELLTRTLNARGYGVRVVSASLEGASMFERDSHIRQYLRAHRAPAVMLIEIAAPTDETPSYVLDVSKFSSRSLAQFGPNASRWLTIGMLRDWRPGAARWAYHAGVAGAHVGLNHLNVGYLRTARRLSDVEPARSFEPLDRQRQLIGPERLASELAISVSDADFEAPRWAVAFREAQRRYLSRHGVFEVHYYLPPVAPADRRGYFRAACVRHEAARCIGSDDPRLLGDLNDVGLWADDRHLLASGARVYTLWLADELVRQGVIGAALDAASTPGAGADEERDGGERVIAAADRGARP